jgi:electron transfer flavoprotein alpha subunit
MTTRIFAYVAHKRGVAEESASELQVAAKRIDPAALVTAIVVGSGPGLDQVCESLQGTFAEVWKIANDALAYPNAELVRQALVSVLPQGGIVLLTHSHFGIDLAPGLAVKLKAAMVSDVPEIQGTEGDDLNLVRQEFGGQVSAHVRCDISTGAVISLRPGAFKSGEAPFVDGIVVDKSSAVGALSSRRRYLETIVAEPGDVDISKEAVLVSVGRGIQEKDNVAFARNLAEAMGAAVSCSRPVVDAMWLPKSRQVGSSGKTVKPKVYLACGISGSFQHLAGIKGNPFIIAINKNPKAPIFQVADVGIVDDILEFLPELTARIQALAKVK